MESTVRRRSGRLGANAKQSLPFEAFWIRKIGDEHFFMSNEDVLLWTQSMIDILKAWKQHCLDDPVGRQALLHALQHDTYNGYWEHFSQFVAGRCLRDMDIAGKQWVELDGIYDQCAHTVALMINNGRISGSFAQPGSFDAKGKYIAACHLLLDIIEDYQKQGTSAYFGQLLGATVPDLPAEPAARHTPRKAAAKKPSIKDPTKPQQSSRDKSIASLDESGGVVDSNVKLFSASGARLPPPKHADAVPAEPKPQAEVTKVLEYAYRDSEDGGYLVQRNNGSWVYSDDPNGGEVEDDMAPIDRELARLKQATGTKTKDKLWRKDHPKLSMPTTELARPDLTLLTSSFDGPFELSDEVILRWLRSEHVLPLLKQFKKDCLEDPEAYEAFLNHQEQADNTALVKQISHYARAYGDREVQLGQVNNVETLLLWARFTTRLANGNGGIGGFFSQFSPCVMSSEEVSAACVKVLFLVEEELREDANGFFGLLLESELTGPMRPDVRKFWEAKYPFTGEADLDPHKKVLLKSKKTQATAIEGVNNKDKTESKLDASSETETTEEPLQPETDEEIEDRIRAKYGLRPRSPGPKRSTLYDSPASFINHNRRIAPKDVLRRFNNQVAAPLFTDREQQVFIAAFKETPKDSVSIAALLPGRSPKECVDHYYATKWDGRYKERRRAMPVDPNVQLAEPGRSVRSPDEDVGEDSIDALSADDNAILDENVSDTDMEDPQREEQREVIRYAATSGLDALLELHSSEVNSSLGLEQILGLLEGPSFQLREAWPKARTAPSDVADRFKALSMQDTYQAVAFAVTELKAWVEESKTGWEACWVLRELKDAVQEATGSKIDGWMLSFA